MSEGLDAIPEASDVMSEASHATSEALDAVPEASGAAPEASDVTPPHVPCPLSGRLTHLGSVGSILGLSTVGTTLPKRSHALPWRGLLR